MKKQDVIDVVASEANQEKEVLIPNNPGSSIRFGLLVLMIGFGGFLIWAFAASLDEGVPSVGTVVVDSKRKVIQHPTGGVIESVLVRDGEKVKEGQVLMRLIDTQSKAAVTINKGQRDLLKKQIESVRPLVNEGYYPRNQFLDLQRQYDDAAAKYKVAIEEAERTEIKSPVSGVVMGVATNTIGGVIQPSSKILEVVPEGDRLVIEAMIQPHLIDKIHAGLEADVHFTALNQRTTPVLSGKVEWVSADRFQDPNRPEIAYYTARVEIIQKTMDRLKGEQLLPGMPADVVIKTGSRSFWNYLVKPIQDRAALSMKER